MDTVVARSATDPAADSGREPGSFTDVLWRRGADVHRRILSHPFIVGLSDGSLSHRAFGYYLRQDSLYLRDYATALRTLAARSPDPGTAAMFGAHADGAVAAEQGLHHELVSQLDPDDLDVGEASPTTTAYTSFLLASTRGCSFAEGVAAVLPCYWIYWRVGEHLASSSSPDPLYAAWIDAYGGSDFGQVTTEVLDLVDHLAPQLGAPERSRMEHHHHGATRYEWMFWDAAHRGEQWPV